MLARSPRALLAALLLLMLLGLMLMNSPAVAVAADPHLGYGVNGWDAGDAGIGVMGFDWTKVFGAVWYRLPYRVLRRVDVNASTLNDLEGWGNWLEGEAAAQAPYIEAWEIGNEPNLDASYGWQAPPNAADYTRVLCEAYRRIKRADPTAIVVSAGLAVTGRVPFTWNGHKGYCAPGLSWCPSYYQDEREFLREMLQAGAADCFDALGFHPYGFAAPATASPGSSECGPNDFCFRTVEVVRQIMVDEFGVDKPIWATEFGWLVDPRQVGESACWDHPSFKGRQWQAVSPDQQAQYLRDAFVYAEVNYPWMGGMFVFNYGFSSGMSGCDQMRFYDIKGRPAEAALTAMAKNKVPARPAWPSSVTLLSDVDAPGTVRGAFRVQSQTPDPLTWSVVSVSSPHFSLTFDQTTGAGRDALAFTVDSAGLSTGVYTATVQVEARPSPPLDKAVPVEGATKTVEVVLRVVEEVYRTALPLVSR